MELKKHQKDFIEQIYREMFTQLYILAEIMLHNTSLSEEAVQDTFILACIKVDDVMDSPNPKGWMVNTLKNVIYNMRRSNRRFSKHILLLDEIDSLSAGGTPEELNPNLIYGDLVSKEEYDLIKRVAIDNCTMLELSEELGITVEACKKRVQRAKTKFRKKYFIE